MRRRRILGTVAPLALAGCLRLDETDGTESDDPSRRMNSGDSEDDPGSDDGSTETDAGSDDADDSAGSDDESGDDGDESPSYPRGVSEDGVSPLLADNHVNSLHGSSFEFQYVLANYTEGWERPSTRASVEADRAWMKGAGIGDETFLRNDLHECLWTMRFRGDRLYGNVDFGPRGNLVNLGDVVFSDHLRSLLRAVSFDEVAAVEREGETIFRVRGDTVEDPSPAVDQLAVTGLDGATVEGYVDADGIVRSLEAELEYTRDGEPNLADFVYEVRSVGETTVPEPDWVSTAADRAPRLSLSRSDDGTYFRLDHEGGQALRPNTKIERTGDRYAARLERELAAGETLYLWFEGDRPRLSREGPPSDATVLEKGIIEVTLESGPYLSWRVRHL